MFVVSVCVVFCSFLLVDRTFAAVASSSTIIAQSTTLQKSTFPVSNSSQSKSDQNTEAASGYIFRHDGHSKPSLINFGDHNLDQLHEFLKQTGFGKTLPKKDFEKPEHPVDDSGGPPPFPGPGDDLPLFHVPSFNAFPSKGGGSSVHDPNSEVPITSNDSGANNYDYDYKDYDHNYDPPIYNGGPDEDGGHDYDVDHTTEAGLDDALTTPQSPTDQPDEGPTKLPYPNETPTTDSDEPEIHEDIESQDDEGHEGHEGHSEEEDEGSNGVLDDEAADTRFNHPTAKRLTSPTVKAFIAPIFDLASKGPSLTSMIEPLKYSMPTIGHHTNEPFHSPLIDDTYGDYHGDGDYHHHPRKHHKGGGSSFDSGYHSSHGDKGEKGYKSHHDFNDGEYGHHGKDDKKGYYNDKSGHKKNYHDGANHYGGHHANEHGKKGSNYGETGHHKKGHKTTGYHNTYHKDEFKKEHKFYDDAHKEGYHDKHGAYHADHGKHSGGKKHGGFHDSGYKEGHKGNSGFYDKGHYDNEHAGHKGASGFDSNFGHFDEFGKKSGFNDNSKFGFSDF